MFFSNIKNLFNYIFFNNFSSNVEVEEEEWKDIEMKDIINNDEKEKEKNDDEEDEKEKEKNDDEEDEKESDNYDENYEGENEYNYEEENDTCCNLVWLKNRHITPYIKKNRYNFKNKYKIIGSSSKIFKTPVNVR